MEGRTKVNMTKYFRSGSTRSNCLQPWRSVPFAPHPLQNELSLLLLILAIPTDVRWNVKSSFNIRLYIVLGT